MKTITINLYDYAELSEEAKKKALNDYNESNENNEDPFLQPHMINLLKEKLDEREITYDDTLDVRYSLSHSQGDGFMFLGKLKYGKSDITIEHNGGHYYHSETAHIDAVSERGNIDTWNRDQFKPIYKAICNEMEQLGYDYIEYQTSAEYFEQECEANDWTFEENGTMRNV